MNPAPNFNSLAHLYRWLEYLSFGPFLWRCRIHFLPQLTHCRRALILGDGDGRFTARLLRANSNIEITAIDASPRMIEALQQAAAPHQDRLTTQVADIRTWQPTQPNRYDLIVTHFFLDCLNTGEIADLTSRLTPYLAPNALWLVSEFAVPPTHYGRTIAAPLVAFLYRAFRLITNLRLKSLPDHSQALAAAGWTLRILQAQHTHLNGLLISQLWQHQPLGPASHCFSISSIQQNEQNEQIKQHEQSENGSKHYA
jgi:trans-aconitate methyltransferase